MPDSTFLYQINDQERSLGTQFLTNARKYVPNEKKGGVDYNIYLVNDAFNKLLLMTLSLLYT